MNTQEHSNSNEFSLSGQLLLAMPSVSDSSFSGAVVYLCEHGPKGAMGLIINRPTDLTVLSLLKKINLEVAAGSLADASAVMFGGPVAADRGFVLHSGSKEWNSSLAVNNGLHLTTSRDILEALAQGEAPKHCLIALGYAGWGEGQLEKELARNDWLSVPASLELMFDLPLEERFEAAYRTLGVDPFLMSRCVGHA